MPSIHRHSSPFSPEKSHNANLPILFAEKQTLIPPPNTLNLLDSWKNRNISPGIRPASPHSKVSKSSLRIKIVEHDVLSVNEDFNPPIIRIVFPVPLTKRGRFKISKTSPHSSFESAVQEDFWEVCKAWRVQEKSFHWLRHGDPTSHKARTESDTKIGLRGLDGKFDENFSQVLVVLQK